MTHVLWRRAARTLAIPALLLALVAVAPLAQAAPIMVGRAVWTPMTPVSVTHMQGLTDDRTANGNLLGFNDFHGAIDKPTGSGAAINGVPAGGVEYLTTYVKNLRAAAEAEGRRSLTVGAGDLIGATPLVSAAFHDEPTIELMNEAIGMDMSSVGNHEFDEGVAELLRMQFGGCHPTDGCQDGDGFAGADFRYLAANVVSKNTGLPILLPFDIRFVDGAPVGFIGMTLEGTPSIVNPAGITSVTFKDEIETANKWGGLLRLLGIKALVLLIHEGGQQNTTPVDPNSCASFAGPVAQIVAGLRPEFGIVVSGHTHRFYSCGLPNSSGATTVVTSAGSNGQLVTNIDFTVDKWSRRFAEVSANNVITANSDPALVDPVAKQISDKYRTAVAPIANAVVGSISATITRDVTPTSNQESPLGDVIADAQLAWTQSAGADIAFMNPGGIRASLTFDSPAGTGGQVTFGECFTVQPFNNLVVTQTFTGAQIKAVLEQQVFPSPPGTTPPALPRILQVSAGFTYTYDTTRPAGDRVLTMALNGVPIDPAASYQLTTNDFLANGGDGFTALTAGTNRVTAPGFDVDALVGYIGANSPVAPGPADRITRLN
jgi:5'-nucleotidase